MDFFKNISFTQGIIAFLCLLVIGVGALQWVGSTDPENIKNGAKRIAEKALEEKFKDIDQRIKLNTEFRVDEYIKLITKNAVKIVSTPDDVKKSDIDLCISYLTKIPESVKTEYIKSQIQIIIKWSNEHP